MPIDVPCDCGKKYRLKDELAGKKFKCKECQKILVASPADSKRPTSKKRASGNRVRRTPDSADPHSPVPPPSRKKRNKNRRKVDPYDDDYRDSPLNALDSFGGSYGDDIDDEQNPYPTPRRNKSSKKKRRMSSAAGLTATQKLFSFEGRINRTDYWLYGTVIEALGALVQIIMNVIFFGEAFIAEGAQLPAAYLAFLVLLAVISVWMGLALHAKRLHDRNKSGFMFLVGLHPADRGDLASYFLLFSARDTWYK